MRTTRRALLRAGALLGAGAAVTAAAAGVEQADRVAARTRGSLEADRAAGPPYVSRVLWRPRTTEPLLALTFDDGPTEQFTRPLLELLDRERVPATFCVVGRRVLAHRDLVRRELSRRHELVSHSFSHPDLSALDDAGVERELARANQALVDVTGHGAALLRPPFGRVSGAVLRLAAEAGQDVLMWNAKVHEQSRSTPQNAQDVLDRLAPGLVLLCHDAGPSYRHVGLAALPAIITGARARGYRFVTASELFALSPR